MNDDFKKIYYPFCIRYFYNNEFSVVKTQHEGYNSSVYFTYEVSKNEETLKHNQAFLTLEQALVEYPQSSYGLSLNFMNLSFQEKSIKSLEALIAFYKENPKKEKNIYAHFNAIIGGYQSKDHIAS